MWIPDGGVSVTTASDLEPALTAPGASETTIFRSTSGMAADATAIAAARHAAMASAKERGRRERRYDAGFRMRRSL